MDKFVIYKKPTHQESHSKETVDHKCVPYPKKDPRGSNGVVSKACIQRTLTQHLLNTLMDESNPITHSDIGSRSDRVVSLTKGHQRSEGRVSRQGYTRGRNQKLKAQREEAVLGALNNTRVYINGYLRDTTDIEMKRMITEAGGQPVQSASNATHIITSQRLSGTKTDRLLTRKPYVVKPEWVIDSIGAGRRLREEKYSVVRWTCT
ncbi:hypothetical protein BC827DRAFT_1259180 [Russula dissimulans]|nr:hypothetical protein BC827DRAFT_1259180 [Russula dissimulans]